MNIHLRPLMRLRPLARLANVRLLLLVTAALYVLGGAFAPQTATAQWDRTALQKALRATVHVVVPITGEDGAYSTGSGTVLDADRGLILTNYHVLADIEGNGDLYNESGIAIIGMMPDNVRGTPVYKYVAELVKGSADWDLAVLRIVGLLDDEQAALPSNLGLIAIERGDSEDLLPGDKLAVVGYPGLGGSSITFTEGVVAGFLDEDEDGVYEWIKTDTEINQGNSGGLTIDSAGNFVGVPTMFRFNTDGGGKLSLVRPGAIALDFYDSAALGQGGDKENRFSRPTQPAPVSDGAAVTNVEFGSAVNNRNRVTGAATTFPSGINDLYVSYDYTGFTRNGAFAYQWYLDGEPVYNDSFQWAGDLNGVDWLNLHSDRGLPDGAYEVEISFAGAPLYRGGVTIGAGAPQPPVAAMGFGPITFATGVDADDTPINAGNTFVDISEIYAIFAVNGVEDGTPWATRWLYNDEEVLSEESEWDAGDVDASWVSLSHPDGLPAGKFTLELYLDGDLNQSANFTVAARGRGQRVRDINVVGVVRDADNNRRLVTGAMIAFLTPGVTTQQWVDADFDESMIHASGASDRSGEFHLDAKVTPGEQYSVIVVHDNYQAVQVDNYEIPADSTDPYELTVTMERR
jgi:hypothetical protein